MKVSRMFRIAVIFAWATLLVVDAAPTRRALMVGLNNYRPGYASSLRGCINDVNGMRDVVMLGDEASRWAESNLQILTNAQGKKAAIRDAFQNLAVISSPGDLVVYYQSSHGGQYSGTSTFICSYDSDYTDTEMGQDLARFDGSVNVVVIIDTCHSGGMFKGKDWPFIENVMASFRETKARQFKDAGLPIPRDFGANIAFMVAADYDEYSWEDNSTGISHGLFTYAMMRACGLATADVNNDGDLQFLEMFDYAAQRTVHMQTAQSLNETLLGAVAVRTAGYGEEIDDFYENNETADTAYDLSDSAGVWLSDLHGPGVLWDMDWYMITVPPEAERIRVICSFSHIEGDIDLALMSESGKVLTRSNGYSDQEHIDYAIPSSGGGRYYIVVEGDYAGNDYDLMWNYVVDDKYEPNDTRLTAYDLSNRKQVWLSTIDGPGRQYDYDWYKIRVSSGSSRVEVDCRFIHSEGSIDMSLYDASGKSVAYGVGHADGKFINYTLPSQSVGDYYIRISGDNAGNIYDLWWNAIPTVPAPDLIVQSISHAPATIYPGDRVTFTVTIKNQGSAATTPMFSTAFWSNRASAPVIRTPPEKEEDVFHALSTNSTTTITFQFSAPPAGVYTAWAFVDNYLGVGEIVESDENNNAGPRGGYAWEVERAVSGDDAYEVNNTLETAFDFSESPETWLSDLAGEGIQFDDDWYAIIVTEGNERIQVDCRFTHADGNIDIALFDATGTPLAVSASASDNEYIETIVPAAGRYYIAVTGANVGNTYDLWWGTFSKSVPPVSLVPVYHFWSKTYRSHYYTTSEEERDYELSRTSSWIYKGSAFYAYTNVVADSVPVYHFWSKTYRSHYYTTSVEERDYELSRQSSWVYKGVAFYAYENPAAGSVPVYHFWSKTYRSHYYTTSVEERDYELSRQSSWIYKGVAFYAFMSQSLRTVGSTEKAGLSIVETPEVSAGKTDGIDVVYPVTCSGSVTAAYVYDSATEQWTCILPATNAPAEVVFENVQPNCSCLLDVCIGDSDGGELTSVHQSWLTVQLDPPKTIHEDSDAVVQENSENVGSPIARVTTPAVDGRPLTVKLYSASQGVVETLTDVQGGETVELVVPEWNCWYWISGWDDAENELVLSIWLRHEREF